MSIKLATVLATKTAETPSSVLLTNAILKDGSASFKEQLESSATQENKSNRTAEAEVAEFDESAKIVETVKKANVVKTAETTQQAQAVKLSTANQAQIEETEAIQQVLTGEAVVTQQAQAVKLSTAKQVQTEETALNQQAQSGTTVIAQQSQADKISTVKQVQKEETAVSQQAQTEKTAVKPQVKNGTQGNTKQDQTEDNALNQQAQTEESAKNNVQPQAAKNKLTSKAMAAKTTDTMDPLDALSAKISTLNELKGKNSSSLKTKIGAVKTENKISDKNDYCQTLKMDKSDATFFLNLVTNQETAAQSLQAAGVNQAVNNNSTEIKSDATQQAAKVSQGLIDALKDSAQTGKSIRIDFDNKIAVVMKLDKDGSITANFIPGDAAVENYLRNNIAGLKQNFDDQNLAYNELTYTRHQKQEQQKQQKQNKENQNE